MLDNETPASLLTAYQVAKALNISMRTLWRLKSAGKLPEAIRVGNSVRWRNDDLVEWIADGCQTPVSPSGPSKRKD